MDTRLLRKYRKLAMQTIYVQNIGTNGGMICKINIVPSGFVDYYTVGKVKHPFIYISRQEAILSFNDYLEYQKAEIQKQILDFAKSERMLRNKLLNVYRDDIGNYLFYKILGTHKNFVNVRKMYYETGKIPFDDRQKINKEVDKQILKCIKPYFNKWIDNAIKLTSKLKYD